MRISKSNLQNESPNSNIESKAQWTKGKAKLKVQLKNKVDTDASRKSYVVITVGASKPSEQQPVDVDDFLNVRQVL